MSLTRIGSIGINTGIAFAGVTTIVTLNTANDALSIGATVNVGSGITLGASGDIFATGVSTFSGNLKVGSGVTISPDGDGFYTGVVTATSFSGSGANLTGIDTDLVSDTSPQLGGNLDVNTKNINFGDSASSSDDRLKFGADADFMIFHDGTNTKLQNDTGELIYMSDTHRLRSHSTADDHIVSVDGGSVRLFHDNSYKFETSSTGVTVNGTALVAGNVELNSDAYVKIGAGSDLNLYHNGTHNYIDTLANKLHLRVANGENGIVINSNGAVELYHDNVKTFHTKENGVIVEGTEGAGAILEMRADEGDDNADYFRLYDDSGFLSFQGYGAGSWTTLLSLQQQNQVRLYYNGSEKLNTSSSGVSISGQLYFNNGNVKFGASGNGIDFSTSQTPSSKTGATTNSEVFDHYEEGTFTPTYDGTWTNISNSNVRHSRYTRVGDVCHVWLEYFMTSNNGEWADNSNLRGFPFTGRQSLYVPVSLTVMYGPSGYTTDAGAAGRAYFDSYDDRLYFKMGSFNGVRHIWVQFSYLVG